jgi:hypothetical protein
MKQRWVVFVAALAGSAVLAVGFAIAAGQLTAGGGPTPRLRTVSASALAKAGYTLSPAALPPYCGVEQEASQRGWLPSGAGGCPVTRSAAEAAATPGGTSRVVESTLARVSAAGAAGPVGRDRLLWLVVARPSMVMVPLIACARGPAVTTPCPPVMPAMGMALVMVDAHSGQTVYGVALTATGGLVPWQPQPGPMPTVGPITVQPVGPIVKPAPRPTATSTMQPVGPTAGPGPGAG